MKRLVFTIIILLLTPLRLSLAQTPEQIASLAQQAYQKEDYVGAIRYWEELQRLGFENASIEYNLGSAYWRLGKAGQAKRYFLSASRLAPRDSEIRDNLNFVEEHLGFRPKDTGEIIWWKRIPFYYLSLSYSESLKIAAFFSLLLFGGLWIKLLKQKRFRYFRLGIFIGFILSFSQLGYNFYQTRYRATGVILDSSLKLREVPVEGEGKETIAEGSLVTLLKSQGKFWLVKTPEGQKGWLKQEEVGKI